MVALKCFGTGGLDGVDGNADSEVLSEEGLQLNALRVVFYPYLTAVRMRPVPDLTLTPHLTR